MRKVIIIALLLLLIWVDVKAAKAYTVTFKSNDQTKIVEVLENEVVTAPVFEKEGYQLLGWSYGEIIFDFTTPITQDLELVAIWQEKEIDNQLSQVDEANDSNNSTGFKYTNSSETVQYLIIIGLILIVGVFKYLIGPKIKK